MLWLPFFISQIFTSEIVERFNKKQFGEYYNEWYYLNYIIPIMLDSQTSIGKGGVDSQKENLPFFYFQSKIRTFSFEKL